MQFSFSVPSSFYHQTTVLFLDDNKAFLDALELQLAANVRMMTFTDPELAMKAIIDNNKVEPMSMLSAVNRADTDTATGYTVDLKLENILKLIYEKSRYENVTVIVVDYEMPGINGVEFCKKLAGRKILKIILTAEADKDIAINAFNNGSIDKFLLKTSKNLHQELADAIDEMRYRYFVECSKVIFENLGGRLKSVMNTESYRQLFQRVALEAKAVEYYLVDGSGSFLFLDENAKPTWLILRDNRVLSKPRLI